MNIRAEMVRRGETQKSVAAKLGISQPAVSSRLRGNVHWTINDMYALSAILRVPLPKLLDGIEATTDESGRLNDF